MRLPIFHIVAVKLDETSLAIVALGTGLVVAELHKIDPTGERLALAFGSALAGFLSKTAIDVVKAANASKQSTSAGAPTADKQDPAA